MENKQTEIENAVAGFTAQVMGLIQHCRGKRDALNQVPQFVEALELARMDAKFQAMLSDKAFADLQHELHIAQHRLVQIAEAEVARAHAGNTVDFDLLASAMRDTGRTISAAVGKLGIGMEIKRPRRRELDAASIACLRKPQ